MKKTRRARFRKLRLPAREKRKKRHAVAIYHLSVKAVSRAKGQNAVASAAYRAGERLRDERTDEVKNFSRRRGVKHTEIILPEGAPEWARDRGELWNQAEKAEKRKNSRTAREIEIALPAELDPKAREVLAREFATYLVAQYGFAGDLAIHAPDRRGDQRNHHAHILLTTRRIGPEGFGEKTRELDEQRAGDSVIEDWRELWQKFANTALKACGREERIDRRSLMAQGIDRIPQKQLGLGAISYERKTGKPSRRRLDFYRQQLEGERRGREKAGIDLGGIASQAGENLRRDDPRDRGTGEGNELARWGEGNSGREVGRVGLYRAWNFNSRRALFSRGPKNAGVGRKWQAEKNEFLERGGAGSATGRQRAVGTSGEVGNGLDTRTGARAGTSGRKPRVHRYALLTNWAGEVEAEVYGSVQSLPGLSLAHQSGELDKGFLLNYEGDPSPEPTPIWGTNDVFEGVQREAGSTGGMERGAKEAGGGISNGEIRGDTGYGPGRPSEGNNTLDIGSPAGNRDITATRATRGAPGRSSGAYGTPSAGNGPAIGRGAGEPQASEGRSSQQTDGDPQGLGGGGKTARPRGKGGANVGNQGTGVDAGDKATTGEQGVGSGSSGDVGRDNERGAYERVLGLARMSEAGRQKARIWTKQAEGLSAEGYKLTLVGRAEGLKTFVVGKKGAEARLYGGDEITNLIPLLSRKNAQGYDVYVTPVSPKHHYLVIDDVKPEKLEQAKRSGIKPCVVLESSKSNFQMILKIPKTEDPDESQAINRIVRELNGKYGDPQFSGAVHPFRVAGFSNRKPERANEFVRVVEASGQVDTGIAQKLERECTTLDEKRAQEEQARRASVIAEEPLGDKAGNLAAAYRQSAKRARAYLQSDDWSRIDYHAAKQMLIAGWKSEAVGKAILAGSPDIATRKHDPEAYSERTVQAALKSQDVIAARAARAARARQAHRGFSR